MTIVVHVGTHKTGTTSVQRFAASNRGRLRKRGLWYPTYSEIGLFRHHAHNHLAAAMSGRRATRLSADDARRFIDHIVSTRKPGESILISAEPFYRLTIGNGNGNGKGKASATERWAARERFLARMKEYLPFDDVRILICLRRQDDFARSVYQERIKVSKYRASFADFLRKDRSIFDYLGQLELFARYFPDIRVATFESLVASGDLHAGFFNLLGVDVSSISKRPVANVSLPIEMVEFKRLLNMTSIDAQRAKEAGRRLVQLAARLDVPPARDLDWLPEARMDEFQRSFLRDNEQLRLRFAPDLPSPLFPPAGRSGRQPFTGLDARRAVEIAAGLADW